MADGEAHEGEEVNELTSKISTLISSQKWEEEDNGDDVKDNWDDEDEEPVKVEPKKTPVPNASTRNKRFNKLATNSNDGNSKQLTAQELREKKLQEEKLQRESDLILAKQMLGMEDKNIKLEFPLETKEDFDLFHKNVVAKLWCYDKSPHYFTLMDRLFRDLCVPLDSEEVKSLSSTLNALFNEKVKALKAITKPKKKGTKGYALKMERDPAGEADFGNDYVDDLDDIM